MEPITRFKDLNHRTWFHVAPRVELNPFVEVRVKRSVLGGDRGDPEAVEGSEQLRLDHRHALEERADLDLFPGREDRALQVVQHRQQLAGKRGIGMCRLVFRLVALGTLLVVLEIRPGALELREVFIPLPLGENSPIPERLQILLGRRGRPGTPIPPPVLSPSEVSPQCVRQSRDSGMADSSFQEQGSVDQSRDAITACRCSSGDSPPWLVLEAEADAVVSSPAS